MRKDLMAGAAIGVVIAGCVVARMAQDAFERAVSRSNEEIYEAPFDKKPAPKYTTRFPEDFTLGIGV